MWALMEKVQLKILMNMILKQIWSWRERSSSWYVSSESTSKTSLMQNMASRNGTRWESSNSKTTPSSFWTIFVACQSQPIKHTSGCYSHSFTIQKSGNKRGWTIGKRCYRFFKISWAWRSWLCSYRTSHLGPSGRHLSKAKFSRRGADESTISPTVRAPINFENTCRRLTIKQGGLFLLRKII